MYSAEESINFLGTCFIMFIFVLLTLNETDLQLPSQDFSHPSQTHFLPFASLGTMHQWTTHTKVKITVHSLKGSPESFNSTYNDMAMHQAWSGRVVN